MAHEERRKLQRHSTFLTCRLEGASRGASARITDLSLAGCYVDTLMSVAVGVRISLHVRLWDTDTVLTGTVVHAHIGQGFAIQFDALPDQTRHLLDKSLRGGRHG